MPRWPLLWLGQLQALMNISFRCWFLPGPLLLLALWRYRDKDAWFPAVDRADGRNASVLRLPSSCGSFPIAPRDSFTAALSWGRRPLALVSHPAQAFQRWDGTTVLFMYLPMLGGDTCCAPG
jgi:hypothetical protein